MNEMVERVAWAVATAFADTDLPALIRHGGLDTEVLQVAFEAIARAAMAEMREPTTAAKLAGMQELPSGASSPAIAAKCYRAMIDAALEPSESPTR